MLHYIQDSSVGVFFCMQDPLSQPWDDSLKKLVHASPQAFVHLIDPDAQYLYELKERLKPLTRDVDGLVLVRRKDGKLQLVHIEIQSTNDPTMPDRMLIYNVLARTQHQLPVLSCVIYLRKDGKIPQSPHQWKLTDGEIVLEFHYLVIEVADMSAEELQTLGEPGLLPLLPLTRGGATREVVEGMFTELQIVGNLDLLQIGQMIASLAFGEARPADQEWVLRRYRQMYERLQDTPLYKEMTRLASEKARAEALKETDARVQAASREARQAALREAEEARQEARSAELKGLREGLLALVQARFPKLLHLTRGLASTIEEPEILRNLIVKMGMASTFQEANQCLIDIGNEMDE